VKDDRPLPINLPAALKLAGARPIDVEVAARRIDLAAAQLEQAQVLWLPTVVLGADYFRHDGKIQDVAGNVFGTSKGALMAGGGPAAFISGTDALFEPLVARQVVQARAADLQTARNDSTLAVAESYFNVQQARGELAGALDAARRAAQVVRKARALVPGGLVPEVEVSRARAEAARRRQAVHAARERWRTASAELNRILRLHPAALVEPLEPPHLQVTLVEPNANVDDLILVALKNRPELVTQQALVRATVERLRQEKWRPFIPNVLLRGASTNPAGTLGFGTFGGGLNSHLGDFGARTDLDIQVLWELRNLGLGNRALIHQRSAETQVAELELFRTQDRVAAEVTQALAQVRSAAARLRDAEAGLKDAIESARKNLRGMAETRSGGGRLLLLVIRPQEVVASVQALAQAYPDYYGAVADYDRAQFRLYRALGQPAQWLNVPGCPMEEGETRTAAPTTVPDGDSSGDRRTLPRPRLLPLAPDAPRPR
jgi:outer membrane protein TolC